MPVLQFKGKTAVEQYHRLVPHHVLELDPKLSLAKKPSLDGNLIIEGDNLLALKALLPTHAGRVKCIYIDPPYNTGNEGWVYNDNLQQPQFKEWIGREVGKEAEDACRHDKWCCMMYPRLALLRELLTEDGAIFISIDDNEVHHLRSMMDEIFGVECFVACFVWQKRYSRENRGPVGTVHDYILAYTRTGGAFKVARNKLLPSDESREVYRNPNSDPRGDWRPTPMTAQGTRKNQMYKIVAPGGKVHYPPKGRCWSMLEPEFLALRDAKPTRIWFGVDGNSQPNEIRYWDEVEGFVPWTWWPHEEVGHTDEAKKELFSFFAKDDVFDSPKPTRLIERILRIYTKPGAQDIVLDSFAGSGTSGHAVLKMNAADGGDRRFVLIQQPYDSKANEEAKLNICRSITRERIAGAIKGGKLLAGEEVKGLGGEFTYTRVGSRLLGEFREFADNPPAYEDLAKYIWFTDTSRPFDPKHMDRKSGRIGVWKETSYYLLYAPDGKGRTALDREFLDSLKDKNAKKKVVYCEKVWVHRDELAAHGVTAMVVPFHLK